MFDFFIYFKLINIFQPIKLNAEELLQDLPKDTTQDATIEQQDAKRERLQAIVAGGGSKQYLGSELQLSDIAGMNRQEVDKLTCRYEARLGASMTKTLANYSIGLYVMVVSKYFNKANPPKLIEDLEEDPIIHHALTGACCELYYRYGMYLAPFTAMLTTARHINFYKNKNVRTENIGGELGSKDE